MRLLFIIMLLLAGHAAFPSSAVQAVDLIDNGNGIPSSIRTQVFNWRRTPSYDGKCRTGVRAYDAFQFAWLSPAANQASEEITINDSQNSVAIKFNSLGGHCDSSVNAANGRVIDQTLRATRTQIRSASVSLLNANRTPTGRIVTMPNLTGRALVVNYGYSYFTPGPNLRYAKEDANVSDTPEFTQFDVSNFTGLAPGRYILRIDAVRKMVNQFVYTDGRPTRYVCVDSNPQIFTDDLIDTPNRCPTANIAAEIEINIVVPYRGTCEVTRINGAPISGPVYLNPGQSFTASFTATNTGNEVWFTRDDPGTGGVESQVILGTDNPLDNTRYGPIRARITGNVFGGLVLSSGATSPEFTHTFSLASNFTGGNFDWRLLKEPAPSIVRIASCDGPEIRVRANQPFIRASGGDVYSGARFGDSGCSNSATTNQLAAGINTRGFFNYPSSWLANGDNETGFLGQVNGTSSSQYAVFASGRIGSIGGNNNFLGNNVYARQKSSGTAVRDLLLANINGNTGGTPAQYGLYYTGPAAAAALPCIDISKAEQYPPANSNDFSAAVSNANGVIKLSGNRDLLTPVTVTGRKIIIVEGTLRLNANITYAPAGYSSVNGVPQVPYLMIIAKGGILMGKTSDQILDGHYVSYPGGPGPTGIIDTCAKTSPGMWPSSNNYDFNDCSQRLVINGSLSAMRIYFKNNYGSVGGPGTAAGSCAVNDGSISNLTSALIPRLISCSSELVDFSPEAYFGNPLDVTGGAGVGIPTSTTELPPVY